MYKILEIIDTEIWSVEEIKNYLRIPYNYDDALIKNLIDTAIDIAERFTNLHLKNRRINVLIPKLSSTIVRLKYIPVVKITKCNLINKNGKMEIPDEDFTFNNDNAEIKFQNLKLYHKKIEIEYISGYDKEIPSILKHSIMLHISKMYDNPEDTTNLMESVSSLYGSFRSLKI